MTMSDAVKCDLCCHDDAVVDRLLCRSCAESIGRLMSIAEWAQGRSYDRLANNHQARMLLMEVATYAGTGKTAKP